MVHNISVISRPLASFRAAAQEAPTRRMLAKQAMRWNSHFEYPSCFSQNEKPQDKLFFIKSSYFNILPWDKAGTNAAF